mmetsp:Transcript_33858/g.110545  ORF Transcript_33858/g.110545 Transcript_33858/m.110545 type:complete len:83 (-) Transcript_33858:127-375(-)
MRLVDADRLLAACEAWRCGGWLGSLAPLSCSPKNSVLVLLPEGDGLAAGLQGIRGQRRGAGGIVRRTPGERFFFSGATLFFL